MTAGGGAGAGDAGAAGCGIPRSGRERVEAGHGGGGALTRDLVEQVFLPALGNPLLDRLEDAAVLPLRLESPEGRLAIATDAHVVQPLLFPGGSIGDLAVNGTVNDLAMQGARPIALTAAFILEEGLPIETLRSVVADMARAARAVGVAVVAGDTKVVERSRGDGMTITTTGIGVVPAACPLGAVPIRAGDEVLVSGPLGNHGMAVMSVREGLAFDTAIVSDTAPLHDLVAALLAACPAVRALRDPTRGGLAAVLGELAAAAGVSIEFEETSVPVEPAVAAACEVLGLDPLQVASEGRLVAVVAAGTGERALAALRSCAAGAGARRIGAVAEGRPGTVVARSPFGGRRVVPMPLGEQFPRIC